MCQRNTLLVKGLLGLSLCGGLVTYAFAQPATQPAATTKPAAVLPSGKQIVDKYIEATGGKAAYEKVTSRHVTGAISLPAMGVNGTLEMWQTADATVSKLKLDGVGKMEEGMNGDVVWELSDITGPRIVTGEEAADRKRSGVLNAELKTDELYKEIKALGVEQINGQPAYKVLFTPKEGGMPETRYFDVASSLLVRTEGEKETAQGVQKVVSSISDYKDFGGILTPTTVKQEMAGMEILLKFNEVQANVAVPMEVLAVPKDIKALQK